MPRFPIALALLALLALLAVATGCHRRKELPVLVELPAFSLLDEGSRAFTRESLHGHVWAVAFVFTRCPTACPRVTRTMRGLQEEATRRGVALRLLSVSVDPDNDSPEVLRHYAEEYQADRATWSFLTGEARAVRSTAEQGFKIAVDGTADPSKPDFGISHGTELVLVDGAGRVRGYYATNDPEAVRALLADAATLATGG